MNFSTWLQLDEARYRGPVGGAFGKDTRKMQQRKQVEEPNDASRMPLPQLGLNNKFQDFHQRVEYGKSIEKQIYDSLTHCGLQLRPASANEDMKLKIDAWWHVNGREEPVQIKYRDTQHDILFEVLKDYYRRSPGRDMESKAKYYAVMSPTKTINVVAVDEIKAIVHQMLASVRTKGFDDNGQFTMRGASLKIKPDPRTGQDKLLAYIPIFMLKTIKTCPGFISK